MYRKILLALALAICLSGCVGNDKREVGQDSNVEAIIQEQISKAEEEDVESSAEINETNDKESNNEAGNKNVEADSTTTVETQDSEESGDLESVDIDLTKMDRTMTYATVYQLMIYPEKYVGQTIKMNGEYYAIFYEKTNKYYHYVLIKDATECCTQGLEFVWDDGSHVYPDEYPVDTTQVEVTGVFETYTEEGDPNLYSRLKDAEFKVIE